MHKIIHILYKTVLHIIHIVLDSIYTAFFKFELWINYVLFDNTLHVKNAAPIYGDKMEEKELSR